MAFFAEKLCFSIEKPSFSENQVYLAEKVGSSEKLGFSVDKPGFSEKN